MKKILLSLTAVAALATAAAPAAAQSWAGHDGGYARAQRADSVLDRLEWKIVRAAQEGRISSREARSLRAELRQAQPLAWRVETGRANGWQRQQLDRTVSRIELALSANRYGRDQRRDGDGYGYGYGRDSQAYGAWNR